MGQILGLFAVLMTFFILLFILIGFVYLYLYIVKKDNLIKHLHLREKKKRKKRTFKDSMLSPLLRAAIYAEPTAKKYPFFANKDQDALFLTRAGNPLGLTLDQFYGMRFILGLGALFFSSIYSILGMPFALLVLLIFPIAGFLGPQLWLRMKAKERQELISVSMPDFLDTVSVTLQAGVSLDGALKQVTNQMDGPLSEEIERFNYEIDLGVTRKLAYQNLISRNSSKELEMLVNSLIQGSVLGVPVSQTFRIQADDLRAMRGFKAKEKAAKASPQITLVTTFFVAPAVFFLIIGLLLLNIIYNPGAFGLDSFF
ncbi:type II secretion system F family protein [Fictibacillus sp. NPDC058756]|uniref:type II secretion system F family protein n=1 Tax=Fictibacillus sp. NPDC058756 TaxID=3346625 RepID=UPI0036862E33